MSIHSTALLLSIAPIVAGLFAFLFAFLLAGFRDRAAALVPFVPQATPAEVEEWIAELSTGLDVDAEWIAMADRIGEFSPINILARSIFISSAKRAITRASGVRLATAHGKQANTVPATRPTSGVKLTRALEIWTSRQWADRLVNGSDESRATDGLTTLNALAVAYRDSSEYSSTYLLAVDRSRAALRLCFPGALTASAAA